jgi:guanylate kinase
MVGDTYKPNESVLQSLPQVSFVAVIGPTAVGKTTLMNAAVARCPALHPVLTTTSRDPRAGEENDVDFHFRSKEEMEARIAKGEYVQVAPNYTGALYATAPEDYATNGIAITPVLADAMPTFKELPFKIVRSIYVLPPSWEAWKERMTSHSFTPEQLEIRMQEAGRSLRYAIDTEDLIFVINDDIVQSTLDFTQAALGSDSAANQYTSHDLAVTLLKELQNR